jgi:hypothetical protein
MIHVTRFEVVMALKFHILALWFITLCTLVGVYCHYIGTYCISLQDKSELKWEWAVKGMGCGSQ